MKTIICLMITGLLAIAADAPKPKPTITDEERITLLSMKIKALEAVGNACESKLQALEGHAIRPAEDAINRTNQFIQALQAKCPSGKLDQQARCVIEEAKEKK